MLSTSVEETGKSAFQSSYVIVGRFEIETYEGFLD